LAIYEELARGNTTANTYDKLTSGHTTLAVLLSRLRRHADAQLEYQKALTFAKKAAHAEPTNLELQDQLGKAYQNVGENHTKQGRPVEAAAALRQAVEVLQRAAVGNPAAHRLQNNLAFMRNNLGIALQNMGKADNALPEHLQAAEILKKWADEYPTIG